MSSSEEEFSNPFSNVEKRVAFTLSLARLLFKSWILISGASFIIAQVTLGW